MASRITEGEIKLFGRPMGPFNVREFQDALIVHREHTLESLGAPVEPEAAAATPLPLPKGLAAQLAGDRDPYKLESVPPDVHLATVQHARLHEAPTLPRRANFVPTSASHPDVAAVPVPPDGCLLVVRIFSPTRPAVAQEFQVLTSQSLCELRDKLYCLAETNNLVDSVAARSSYLFIEDCFYDDTRHPQALKHSSSVIAWAKGDQVDGNTLTAGVMQDTTFRDLTIWLNKPYLFCHHGDCEHIFTFADLRGVEPSDEQDKNHYPIEVFRGRRRMRKCRICQIFSASHVTYNDVRAPENPCFFCDICFGPLHYTAEGVRRHHFEHYEYRHEE